MSVFEHGRFAIYNAGQHPYKHDIAEFFYSNPAFGDQVVNLEQTLDYIIAVLYPQMKPAVDTPADLPLVGNTLNDMRVVLDDGDGKAASYRWEQREGEASASWHKIYDVDFGTDSILQSWQIKTQDVYVFRLGYDDRDGDGDVITGDLAGQTIYGGASASTNLTLFANSGDGVGAATGYVQMGDNVRPLVTDVIDLGTDPYRFGKLWALEADFDGIVISGGTITDADGILDFVDNDLDTTGVVSADSVQATGSASSFFTGTTVGTLVLADGSITDSGGTIDFDDESLTTAGTVTAGTLVLGSGSITDDSGAIDFGNENLATTGTLGAGNTTVTRLDADNLRLDGNRLSAENVDGDLELAANGNGDIVCITRMQTGDVIMLGTVDIGGQLNIDSLRLDGNTLSSTVADTNIALAPNGAGLVTSSAHVQPTANGTLNLGAAASRFATLYLATGVSDGTTSVASSVIQSLRDINVGVGSGMSLFWTGSKWEASLPDTEVDHGTVTGLGDDDHTQYALLLGRSGGQTLNGSTLASENLNLESTSHGTKGKILAKSTVAAFTDAAYSAGWSGADLGGSGNRFRHVYTAGEYFGLRLENVGALPTAATPSIGRLVFYTSDNRVYVDTGAALVKVGDTNRFETDTSWNGSDVSKVVAVTTANMDARKAVWQLKDNTNDYETVYATIKATAAGSVTISVGTALPAGSYRLVGLE